MASPNCQPCTAVTVNWDILQTVFGERFWNDSENIFCVPTNQITPNEWWELETNHDIQGARDAQYLIAEL